MRRAGWADNRDGTVSIRVLVNSMVVTAEDAGAQPLINNRVVAGLW